MNFRLFALTVLIVAAPALSCAQEEFLCKSDSRPPDQKQVLRGLEKRYETFSDLKAEFAQRSFFAALGKRENSAGNVEFKRPGMMNWDYVTPKEQRFVTNGTYLWFYQPDLNQVTVGDFSQSFNSDLPVSFLLGAARVEENFDVEKTCVAGEGVVLKLKPKQPDPNLDEFYLLLRKEDFLPIGARIVDMTGNETVITFHSVKVNPGLKAESFNFEIPRGTDIIDNRGKGAEMPRP